MTDIAAQRFDAGVRSGNRVDKDMVAVRIAPDLCMAVAASPDYLRGKLLPASPQDLTAHHCIDLRLPTHGVLRTGGRRYPAITSTTPAGGRCLLLCGWSSRRSVSRALASISSGPAQSKPLLLP
ncbi:type 2 periplasmic-binding domain-containing protein [Cupriavidus agavae]|uniref:hypothetical protein n=1 Tax=Cupriavidus agavae TaxID=1001822 RepID=UPI002E25ACFC